MIWLKENVADSGSYKEVLIGYVPQLDKRYSEKEIRALNEHRIYQGWTKLAELVMKIQGYSYTDGESNRFPTRVTSIAGIEFDFDFECFAITQGYEVEQYIRDIHNVLSHLKLYKVKEKDIIETKKQLMDTLNEWEHLITTDTANIMTDDLLWKISKAEETADNIKNLNDRFTDLNLDIPDIFCANVPKNLTKIMDEERFAIKDLVC